MELLSSQAGASAFIQRLSTRSGGGSRNPDREKSDVLKYKQRGKTDKIKRRRPEK